MYTTRSCAFGTNSNPESKATSTVWISLEPGRTGGAWREGGRERHLQRRVQHCPLRSSPVPVLPPVPSPVCPGPSAAPFPAAGTVTPHRDGALRRIRCCRHKERFSHYRFRIEGMSSLVFRALIYKGLMVASAIISRLHIKSSLLLKATQ